MRWIGFALLLLGIVAALPAQPPPKGVGADKKPVDKKPVDKKPVDKMDKSSTTSITEGSKFDGETVDQWIGKLSSPDPSIRDTALRVLPSFGAPAEKALPKIMSMMVDDVDTTVKVTAIRVMTTTSPTD